MGTRGNDLHDSPESVGQNYPDFGTYSRLLTSGHINDTISNAGEAAADGVPYPYPNFVGPAYAAIAPIPQAASYNNTVVLTTDQQIGVSEYNPIIAEVKTHNAHGVNADLSETISHLTGSNLSRRDSAYNGLYGYQSAADIPASHHWVQASDQRSVFEGYITYKLPVGRGERWATGAATMDSILGGWTLGAYGIYATGTPIGTVNSTIQYPFFFSTLRSNFANGATATNIKNQFGRESLDLANLNDPVNRDFNPDLFATPALGTLGNSPYNYNHWRWNSEPAQENVSLSKAFAFGPKQRFQASLRAEFYDVFNRHYWNSPDINPNDVTFGQITGVSGTSRNGQLGARLQW